MHHAKMVQNVVVGLKEVLQQEQVLTENTAVIEAPVDNVANAVQNTDQQLATHIQKIKTNDSGNGSEICCRIS